MATLQKFKFLASQCAVAGSPTRSPTTSPVIHLRRRKTLRMLLSRAGSGTGRRLPRSEESPDRKRNSAAADPSEKNKELAVVSHKLKDFFLSSPTLEERATEKIRDVGEEFSAETAVAAGGGGGGGVAGRRVGQRSLRPLSAAFRQRLLRRAWRPVLVSIPE
ncbi:hypothetical protein LOK49_LG04G03261 [Camellia lanceoleosa]|uniref:Uncharacterized protein n=1 Tax=Camellia lanceoleosa TaxID=1840588 RepID=A0ACC0HVN4_9ERIC|nr:hypothetical protein LOK49_LG04G03261 [Camellia lanceoleosa]